MKIFDAVYTAAVFLQLDELCDALNAEDFDVNNPAESMTEELYKELDILTRCCNLVIGELAESDFPLKTKCELNASAGRVNYADFGKKVTDILSVAGDGKRLPFKEYFDCFTVPYYGKVEVSFTFAPEFTPLNGVSPYSGNKPSARLVAYGIAREYCLISGMTDDAAMWDGRFSAAATEQAYARGSKTVPARRWR